MKKLLVLTTLILLKLTSFSQTDTTPVTKCFPIPVVKIIIKDLLSGDSAKALLVKTEEQVDSLNKIRFKQDSIIGVYVQKEKNFDTIIAYERNKFNTLQIYTNKVEGDLKRERVKSKFMRFGNYTLLLGIGAVAYLLK